MSTTDAVTVDCNCKVGRVIDQYDVSELHEELAERWGEDSLRDLEQYVNQQLLRAAMHRADMEVLDGEVENFYNLLVGDETSEGVRVEARKRLERASVDVEAVQDDFVSHQSIHTHLTECLDTAYEQNRDDEERIESATNTVFALQNRTAAVTDGTLSQLRDAEVLALDEFDVFVDVNVTCEACGRHHEVGALIERGGCECQQ
ncbi:MULTISPECIES: rod-determining factor RdfA [Halostella]|uniref:rod-determining factor RdfA n=1 Tax=Halostella TaxID=1843185 RepID=UPI00108037A8|nr:MULTISPECIES: rod-determining factor RdfA [Halostella]